MPKPYEHLTLAQVATYPRPGTVAPARLGFTPDGSGVTYLFSEEGSLVRSLWRYDIATGQRTVLAGPPPAVDAAIRVLLLDARLTTDNIRYDKFS